MSAGPLPILLAAPGLPGEPDLVARLGHPGSPVSIVRRCVDAVDLIGASASGTARAAVISGTLGPCEASFGRPPLSESLRPDPSGAGRLSAASPRPPPYAT